MNLTEAHLFIANYNEGNLRVSRLVSRSRSASYAENEKKCLKILGQHRNVAQLIDVVQNMDYTDIVIEYCEFTLNQMLFLSSKGLSDEVFREVLCQTIEGVLYIHSKGIYHRNINPTNILISAEGPSVKLTGFGCSSFQCMTLEQVPTECDTRYMAPECFLQNIGTVEMYSCMSADVWSIGMTMINALCYVQVWEKAYISDSCYRMYASGRWEGLQSHLKIERSFFENAVLPTLSIDLHKRISLQRLLDIIEMTDIFKVTDRHRITAAMSYDNILLTNDVTVSPPMSLASSTSISEF